MSHVPAKGTVPQAQLANSQDVELKWIPSTPPTIDPEEDIMQLARIGNLAGVQRLFESGRFDATYKDEQAITPLHVRQHFSIRADVLNTMLTSIWAGSGPRLTINMRSASFSSMQGPMSTQKGENPWPRQRCGQRRNDTTTW